MGVGGIWAGGEASVSRHTAVTNGLAPWCPLLRAISLPHPHGSQQHGGKITKNKDRGVTFLFL